MAVNRFKVATFNLLNLVLPEHVFYNNEKYTLKEYGEKKQWLANQLIQMNADIVGFQEVFHEAALQDVLVLAGTYNGAQLVVANDTGTSPVVGLVSRFPIISSQIITHFPQQARLLIDGNPLQLETFSRPVIQAQIRIPTANGDVDMTVFVVHLKSKRPAFRNNGQGIDQDDPLEIAWGNAASLIIRAAEATALRYMLAQTMKNTTTPVLLMGDINDGVNAVTSEIMSGMPPYRYLPAAKKAKIWDILLSNVKDIQSRTSYEDFYYTHIFNGHYESLDHILVSNEFMRSNPAHIGYVEYVRVFNDHLIDETISNDKVAKTCSDHGQVVATLRFGN